MNHNEEFQLYDQMKERLLRQENFDEDYPFEIELNYYEHDNELIYDVVINNSKIDMYHCIFLVYANESQDQLCPSLGIFDSEIYSIKKQGSQKKGMYKGVILSGKSQERQNIRLYIQYYSDESLENKNEMFIEVKDEIR
jgi:hypothetical protein